MKNKYLFRLAAHFLASLVFLVTYHGKNLEWKGTIEEEERIKVIKNPREPNGPPYSKTYGLHDDFESGLLNTKFWDYIAFNKQNVVIIDDVRDVFRSPLKIEGVGEFEQDCPVVASRQQYLSTCSLCKHTLIEH